MKISLCKDAPMRTSSRRLSAALLLLSAWASAEELALAPDPPINCEACAGWNAERKPFRVFGNTYYVGVAGLSAVLIASPKGLILLDGDLPQSAALIARHIRELGYQTKDIRLIVNSHAHFDHAGGIAALQRASGAVVAASPEGAKALTSGELPASDPQFGLGAVATRFPPLYDVHVVRDGEMMFVGDMA